ncbi:MAG TPA: hypothetical protein VMS56_01125 [Thermoanaerobaculia bacterium]|nr:hypothetical protein [Thermoanaerobaculia bacterium]
MRILVTVVLSILIAGSSVRAQHAQHEHHPMAGSGERLGSVEFPVSCAPEVRAQFERGVALLHSFWYDEAERTFRAVAAADRRCGMAWWGVAMAQYHPLWTPPSPEDLARGRKAANEAKAAGAKTPRERAYIDAIRAFYFPASADHPTRARAYEKAIEELVRRHPDDDEAKIFHALMLIEHGMSMPNDKTYTWQKKAAASLNAMLEKHPEHPGIAHYVIHSFDYPALAHLAVDAAHAYSKIAPSSAHALHMPSHIFVRLGMWADTIDSNRASAAAGIANVRTPGVTSWDSLHAWDYLAYAHLQRGEDAEVEALMREMREVSKLDANSFAAYYALAAVPARYALERRDWAGAAALEVEPAGLAWEKIPYAEALTAFARAVGAARRGEVGRAREDLARLGELRGRLESANNAYWAEQVRITELLAEGWIARAEGRDDDALARLRSAADREDATEKSPVTPGAVVPAREMLGDLLLELGRPSDALAEYERSLADNPNRLNGLTGAARAAQLAGARAKALDYYARVGKLLGGAGAGTETRVGARSGS